MLLLETYFVHSFLNKKKNGIFQRYYESLPKVNKLINLNKILIQLRIKIK